MVLPDGHLCCIKVRSRMSKGVPVCCRRSRTPIPLMCWLLHTLLAFSGVTHTVQHPWYHHLPFFWSSRPNGQPAAGLSSLRFWPFFPDTTLVVSFCAFVLFLHEQSINLHRSSSIT
jgi:hypothetical protein